MNVVVRRFRAHSPQADSARVVAEKSFEAAAVAYVEHLHLPDAADQEVSVIVRDLESGHEHCFRIDLASGDISACG